MFAKLEEVAARYAELEEQLADPDVFGDQAKYRALTIERSELEEVVAKYREYLELSEQIQGNEELLADDDPELRSMAEEELGPLREQQEALVQKLQLLLLPKDPMDAKNAILEIRAGAGGDEAALFAADLFRMYTRYVERLRWKLELMSSNATGVGGFKEVIALVTGDGVFSKLKFESGVHRVQRVPVTESSGRIHTSTVTVAIMPEADEVDVQIDEGDLNVEYMRASGPGGQSVNTTDSKVVITHVPSGIRVTCQDEKSQHKNKAKALKILRSRLLEAEQAAADAERSEARRLQVGTGDRSEKIRTYNFPQSRVTDHRIGLTQHNLDAVLDGDIVSVIEALQTHQQLALLKGELGEEGVAASA